MTELASHGSLKDRDLRCVMLAEDGSLVIARILPEADGVRVQYLETSLDEVFAWAGGEEMETVR